MGIALSAPTLDDERARSVNERYARLGFQGPDAHTSYTLEGIENGRMTPIFLGGEDDADTATRSRVLIRMPDMAPGDAWFVTGGVPDSTSPTRPSITFSGARCTDPNPASTAIEIKCVATGENAVIGAITWDDPEPRHPYYRIWIIPTYTSLARASLDEAGAALGFILCAGVGIIAIMMQQGAARAPKATLPAISLAALAIMTGVTPFFDVENRPWSPPGPGVNLSYFVWICLLTAVLTLVLACTLARTRELPRTLATWTLLIAVPVLLLGALMPIDGQSRALMIAKATSGAALLLVATQSYLKPLPATDDPKSSEAQSGP